MKPYKKHDKWVVPHLGKQVPATLWSNLSGSTLRCIDASRLPSSPEAIESRVAQWASRFLVGQIPLYRVDQKGLKIAPPCRLATSIDWADIALSLDFEHEVKTEYEGFKSAPKLLVLHTTVGPRLVRQRVALPKLREPLGFPVHENSWEVSRAALLQLIRNAPGPIRISAEVFADLEINPYSWERDTLPRWSSRVFLITIVAGAIALAARIHEFNNNSIGWDIAAFVGFTFLVSAMGTLMSIWLMPLYFGPSIVFCNQDGLFDDSSSSARSW